MNVIQVNYRSTSTAYTAKTILQTIKQYDTIACDFEVAIRYTADQLSKWQALIESGTLSKLEALNLRSKINATALDHPSHCTLTHCSIATSPETAYVFILDNSSITKLILNFLTTTTQTQIWHNASYDFRHLYYHTGKFPTNYEDTQLLAKSIINHVDTFKARTGLKELAGRWYGDWGISSDNFTLAQMYEPHVIRYAAIDACATYQLWNYINEQCDKLDLDYADTGSLSNQLN